MKQLIAILLVLGMCFQFALKLGIVAWYNANKTYVATVLCENKDKPKMKCCGKCYLNKQLKKADQQGTNNHPCKSQQIENADYVSAAYLRIAFRGIDLIRDFFGHYIAPSGHAYHTSVFHPPPSML